MTIHDLPDKTLFPSTMPRYPNLWILVSDTVRAGRGDARELMFSELQRCTDMYNDFGYGHNAEGCDAFARRRGLQPIHLGENENLSHDHCLHLRFYEQGVGGLPRPFFFEGAGYHAFAASVHYEVDRPRRLHPYVDECPLCGCTGAFTQYLNTTVREKNENLHDPLGLELVLYGTVRGEPIVAFSGLDTLSSRFELDIIDEEADRELMNTARVGVVVVKRDRVGLE